MLPLLALLLAAATPTETPTETPTPTVPRLTQEVLVQAIRADEETPVTASGLDHAALERANHGQEMPFVLGLLPSVTFQSDSGVAAGYSYFSLRGISMTRVNITFDGVPLNDPEDSGVYLSNVGDFTSAVDNVQVQRGVATSSVGAAAYGGAVSFESIVPGESADLGADLGAGSFRGRRGSVVLHSGRRGRGPAVWTRGSLIRSDGYRYHSGVHQGALLFGGNVHARGWLLALSGFTGREESGLAFLAAERAEVERDPRQNPLQPEEVDRFRQSLVQLQGARRVGTGTLVLQGYYNGVAGWYRLWADPVSRLDLQPLGIDGRMLGARSSYTVSRRALTATLGLHAADFDRRHTLDVQGARRYANTGHKNEANGFLKLAADRRGWHVDGELQLRGARFAYAGDLDLRPVTWTFLNARVGARRRLGEAASLYATLGRVRREPTRNDLFAGEDNPSIVYDLAAVRPERALGIEAGGSGRWSRVTAHANVYTMQFRDEIALTGELSPIGLALRENVGRSFRRGVEADAAWEPAKALRLVANGHWSVGRISEWPQLYDVVEGGTVVGRSRRVYRDVPPLLSPGLTVNTGGEWRFRSRASVRVLGRYVSRSFLDNTGLADFQLPASFDVAGTLEVELPAARFGRPRLRLVGQNLLDSRQWAAGYSASAIVRNAAGGEEVEGVSYYFPLAGRSVVAILSFRLGK